MTTTAILWRSQAEQSHLMFWVREFELDVVVSFSGIMLTSSDLFPSFAENKLNVAAVATLERPGAISVQLIALLSGMIAGDLRCLSPLVDGADDKRLINAFDRTPTDHLRQRRVRGLKTPPHRCLPRPARSGRVYGLTWVPGTRRTGNRRCDYARRCRSPRFLNFLFPDSTLRS